MEEETTRKFTIATILVLVVALVSINLNDITGNVPRADKAKSLTVVQQGKLITVQVNPIGYSGMPGKWIDMRSVVGTSKMDEQTKCDYQGPKPGTSQCYREIAEFSISGDQWKAGNMVQFNIRGTTIRSPQHVIK